MSALVSRLDRQLARKGETVRLLRHPANGERAHLDVRARLKGFEPRELIGAVTQFDMLLIHSPTEIYAAGSNWPGEGVARWHRKGERIAVRGGNFVVQSGGPVIIGGEVVRLEYVIRGGTQ